MHKLELSIPPAIVLLILAIVMWFVADLFYFLSLEIPAHTMIAAVLGLLGSFIIFAGALSFFRMGTTTNPMKPEFASSLVITGIYRFSRNPMYLGLAIILFSWGIFLSNLLSMMFVIAFIVYMNRFQIEPEERMLQKLFGVQFEYYKRSVRRWL